MLLQALGIQDKRWQKQSFVQQNISPYIDGTAKKRLVEAPSMPLKVIQKRIKNHLMRCNFPDYVYSGIKKKSYVENVGKHQGHRFVYKIDISAFFPNTSRDKVYRFFINELRTSPDVADILTNLCTSDLSRKLKNRGAIDQFLEEKSITQLNHLCTGASPSPVLSYLVNQDMFDEMKKLCDIHDMSMTIYVDDTIFSSKHPIPANIRREILNIVEKYGYTVSSQKVKYYGSTEVKKITGVIIRSNGTLAIPNRLRSKIKHNFLQYRETSNSDYLNKLRGCVVAARQIDKTAYPSLVEYLNQEPKKKKQITRKSCVL